jgi:hypothetical protein
MGTAKLDAFFAISFDKKKYLKQNKSGKMYPNVHIFQMHSLQFYVPYLPWYSPVAD